MNKKILKILLISMMSVFLFSCELQIENLPVYDFASLPSSLKATFYLNYSSAIGTTTVTNNDIDVKIGTDPSEDTANHYNYASEFDTSTLIEEGYSITTTHSSDSDNQYIIMVCTKANSPTLMFDFTFSLNEAYVNKFVDNVRVDGWGTCFSKTDNYVE